MGVQDRDYMRDRNRRTSNDPGRQSKPRASDRFGGSDEGKGQKHSKSFKLEISRVDAIQMHSQYYSGDFEVLKLERSSVFDSFPFAITLGGIRLFFGLPILFSWNGFASTDGYKIVISRLGRFNENSIKKTWVLSNEDVKKISINQKLVIRYSDSIPGLCGLSLLEALCFWLTIIPSLGMLIPSYIEKRQSSRFYFNNSLGSNENFFYFIYSRNQYSINRSNDESKIHPQVISRKNSFKLFVMKVFVVFKNVLAIIGLLIFLLIIYVSLSDKAENDPAGKSKTIGGKSENTQQTHNADHLHGKKQNNGNSDNQMKIASEDKAAETVSRLEKISETNIDAGDDKPNKREENLSATVSGSLEQEFLNNQKANRFMLSRCEMMFKDTQWFSCKNPAPRGGAERAASGAREQEYLMVLGNGWMTDSVSETFHSDLKKYVLTDGRLVASHDGVPITALEFNLTTLQLFYPGARMEQCERVRVVRDGVRERYCSVIERFIRP